MTDVQQQMQMQQVKPYYYNQNNFQTNPVNNQPNPYIVSFPPQPQSKMMQTNQMNSARPVIVYQIVNPGYPPCPFCHQTVPSIARYVTGKAQVFWCIMIFLVCPFLSCVPCCMQSCDDIYFECSGCRRIKQTIQRPICKC